jgi:hypothetical protein
MSPSDDDEKGDDGNSDAVVALVVARALAVAGQWCGCGDDGSSSNGSHGGSFGG